MKRSAKIALGIALTCIGLGLILAFVGKWMLGPSAASDVFVLDSIGTESKTVPITEPFHSVEINDIRCDVRILPAGDGECAVSYTDSSLYIHSIEVKDYTLFIEVEETGTWADHLFVLESQAYMDLYLPEQTLVDLNIATTSGDIDVSSLSARSIRLSSTSGDILCTAQAGEELCVETISGNIELSNSGTGTVSIRSTSGEIDLCGMQPATLSASSTSGDIELEDLTVAGKLDVSTSSGCVGFSGIDAPAAGISTASGDVEGTVLTTKHFITSTISGDVLVEDTALSDQVWEVSTASGSIEIQIGPD